MKKKKKKLDKVKLVKEISRDRIGTVPRTRKLENKKRDYLGSCSDDDEYDNYRKSLHEGS